MATHGECFAAFLPSMRKSIDQSAAVKGRRSRLTYLRSEPDIGAIAGAGHFRYDVVVSFDRRDNRMLDRLDSILRR